MTRTCVILALFAAVTLGGCTLGPPKDLIGYIDLHSARNQQGSQFQVTASGVVSPAIQLSRDGDEIRGWADGQLLELRVEGNQIKGVRGSTPVELHVSREGDAIVARGMYGGQIADLAICAPVTDGVAPPVKVESITAPRSCRAENAPTVAAMVKQLGGASTMAMLVPIYYQ